MLERQNAEKETRELAQKLGSGEREVNSMIADIEENLDSVYSISWQNYKLVMDTFHARIGEVNQLVDELKFKGIACV